MKNIEIRTISSEHKPHLREVSEGESRLIEGYAVVFGQKSEVLCDWSQQYEFFREIIEPGAITEDLLNSCDIRLLLYHDPHRILGRSINGEGSLQYGIDETGVWFRSELANTPDGQTALEGVKRGDICGCSFAFRDGDNVSAITWTKDEDGIPVRHVNSISMVRDFTLTTDPAYQQTSVEKKEVQREAGADAEEAAQKAAELAAEQRAKEIEEENLNAAAAILLSL